MINPNNPFSAKIDSSDARALFPFWFLNSLARGLAAEGEAELSRLGCCFRDAAAQMPRRFPNRIVILGSRSSIGLHGLPKRDRRLSSFQRPLKSALPGGRCRD